MSTLAFELASLRAAHTAELEAARANHESQRAASESALRSEMDRLRALLATVLTSAQADVASSLAAELSSVHAQHDATVASMVTNHKLVETALRTNIDDSKIVVGGLQSEVTKAEAASAVLQSERDELRASHAAALDDHKAALDDHEAALDDNKAASVASARDPEVPPLDTRMAIVSDRIKQLAFAAACSAAAMTGQVNEADAMQLAEVTHRDHTGTAAVSAAAMVAAELMELRDSKLSSVEDAIGQLEAAVQHARQSFVAVAAQSSPFGGQHAAAFGAALRSNAIANGFELTRRRATRMAEAILTHLNARETVTLGIRYNELYGGYDETSMREELLAIGTPDEMACDVSAWLAGNKGETVVRGSLHSTRTIVSQLEIIPSILVDIVPTQQQKIAVRQAGIDLEHASMDEQKLALEQKLGRVAGVNDQLVSTALWDCVSVLLGERRAEH